MEISEKILPPGWFDLGKTDAQTKRQLKREVLKIEKMMSSANVIPEETVEPEKKKPVARKKSTKVVNDKPKKARTKRVRPGKD